MTRNGCKLCSVGQCHREKKEKKGEMAERRRVSYIILWKISMTIETYRANRFPLAIMQMWMWHVSLHPAWCYERGIHQHLAALPLLLPLALAMFTHPLILGRFHTPPPLCLPPPPHHQHHVSILHSSSSSLPASSLSCSRCGVAIATAKCGNTSVLHSAGKGGLVGAGGRQRGRGRGWETDREWRGRQQKRQEEWREGSVEKTVN